MSSHKREAINDLPILTANGLYNHDFPTDLFVRIGSFWTGKEFSTYLLAASSSRELCEDIKVYDDHASHFASTSKAIMRALVQRCSAFLGTIDAPQNMTNLLRERCDEAIEDLGSSNGESYRKSVSEWCAFLDYCESTPIRLSESRFGKKDDELTNPLWVVGYGRFGESSIPSILSVPSESWRPELIFLGEKWMIDFVRQCPQLKNCILDDPFIIEENIGHMAAVMSWDKPDYLALMHTVCDMSAGMTAFHEYPIIEDNDHTDTPHCYLDWLSKEYCENMSFRQALGETPHLKWMKKCTEYDNNMLAAVETEDSHIPQDHMDKFGERIIKLMKEVVTWYKDDD